MAEAEEQLSNDSESEKRAAAPGKNFDPANEKVADEQEFEAIRTPQQQQQQYFPYLTTPLQEVRSRSSARSHKSYDGYTVDQDDQEGDTGDSTDPNRQFEVRFDGEEDPMNPKNRSTFRKWVIVLIVAFGSLCVTCASALYTVSRFWLLQALNLFCGEHG